ncbi:MAG: hypothetical protein ACJ0HU_03430 [Gammaproteobacteria bacterium]
MKINWDDKSREKLIQAIRIKEYQNESLKRELEEVRATWFKKEQKYQRKEPTLVELRKKDKKKNV